MYLVTEVREVTRDTLDLLKAEGSGRDMAALKEQLGMEIYDVIWNAVDLANICGIDLEQAFARKSEINKGRTW